MTPSGAVTILHAFGASSTDGILPQGPLILGGDGAFYGTTYYGGGGACPSEASCGTVFRITPAGAATTLYAFSKPTSDGTTSYADGYNPTAFLIRARDGNFYGTTESGGLISQSRRTGTIFRLTPSGLKTILYNFGPLNEAPSAPIGGLIEATDGTFYGVTSENGRLGSVGARSGAGTVFKMVVP